LTRIFFSGTSCFCFALPRRLFARLSRNIEISNCYSLYTSRYPLWHCTPKPTSRTGSNILISVRWVLQTFDFDDILGAFSH
jgi:hypothetical protein